MATDQNYSQNYIANTFAVGIHRAVGVTRGILVIAITSAAAVVSPARFWDTVQKYIKTKKIRIPDEEEEIVCDVVLLNPLNLGIMKKAILLSQRYDDIKVYDIDEVKIVK